jgi:hypothetical protein
MQLDSIVIFACISIFSLVLFLVSILSYYKYRKIKLLLISMVFLMFLSRSLLLSFSLFSAQVSAFIASPYIWLFDLLILLVLYITSLKR